MINMAIAEDFKNSKKAEYSLFVEQLGAAVYFSEDKWVCDKLRRSPAEPVNALTIRFNGIPEYFRDMVKYFSVISLIQRKTIWTVKSYIRDLIRFFNFWLVENENVGLHTCDKFIATRFYHYLENCELAKITKYRTW